MVEEQEQLAAVKHRDHKNIMTFVDNQQILIRDHIGWAPLHLVEKLIDGPFGYEWALPAKKFNKKTWTKDHKEIVWNHIMPFYEGYGYVAQMMIHGLKQLGVNVSIFYKPSYDYLKSDIMDCLFKPKNYEAWGIWHHFWMRPGMLPHEKKAIYTMWESTKLNDGWAQTCNEVRIVFVPCQQNVNTFKNNGVKAPIHVLQHGVDQEYYFYRPKQKKDYFLFGTIGSLVPRKNPELLIKAFNDEFMKTKDVKLYLKDTSELNNMQQYESDKIIVDYRKISPLELGDLLGSFDIGVFPSRGEGFGLGGLQAMGTGTTCICTNWGGPMEYLDTKYNYALDYNLVNINKVPSNNTTYSGQWAEADYEHLRHLMRYAYEHQDEIHAKGAKAAQWVKEYWTWERAAQQLIDVLDAYEEEHEI